MAIRPDGYTLAVTTPVTPGLFGLANGKPKGNVLIFDLRTLNMQTGKIDAPVVASQPSDGISGKGPENVSATRDPDHFLVSTPNDYARGLSTLVLSRDADGAVVGATLSAIRMNQPSSSIRLDRLNIQRAQSAVLVEHEGVEYAIVSDDNYNFLDAYWRAMFEPPMYVQLVPLQFGPPTAIGGSANAKQVNVGGKLGIIQDPFGTPKYLGATLPLDGYGIKNLSVSEDGKVVIGQLAGYLGTNQSTTKPHLNYAWSSDALIEAALAMPENRRMSYHFTPAANSSLVIEGAYTAYPVAGTNFDPSDVVTVYRGRPGDINMINLDDLVKNAYDEGMDFQSIEEFSIDPATLSRLEKRGDIPQIVGLTQASTMSGAQHGALDLMSTLNDGETVDQFRNGGIFYVYRHINNLEVKDLRDGKRLRDLDRIIPFRFKVKLYDGTIEWRNGQLIIEIKDVPQTSSPFFGDRPLENPGYSEFKLNNSVGIGQENDLLDVFKVEQRLRYLGFPALGSGNPSKSNNLIQEFTVNGTWDKEESRAAYLFNRVVNFSPTAGQLATPTDGSRSPTGKAKNATSYFAELESKVGQYILSDATTDKAYSYLNAYNAPHWMNIGVQMERQLGATQSTYSIPNWDNRQTGGSADSNVERYGTSWMRDLLVAKNYADATLHGGRKPWFNGAVDANHGYTPFGHGTHDLGMALDLGMSNYVSVSKPGSNWGTKDGNQFNSTEPATIAIEQDVSKRTWSNANAVASSSQLPSQGNKLGSNNQQAALRDFLSLYAVTRNDQFNSRDQLPIINGGTNIGLVRTALFGDGTQQGSLISKVFNGGTGAQNPYKNIRAVLTNLGIDNGQSGDHQNHFHVYLNPPDALPIGSKPLLAESIGFGTQVPQRHEQESLADAVHDLLAQWHTNEEGEEQIMFSIDVPNIPLQDLTVMVAQASSTHTSSADAIARPKFNKVFKSCLDVENTIGAPERPSNQFPLLPIVLEKLGYHWDGTDYNVPTDIETQIRSSVIEKPKHGKVTLIDAKNHIWAYESDPNYLGKDRVSFLVEAKGKRFKTVIDLAVVQGINENEDPACVKMFNLAFENLPDGTLGEVRGSSGVERITLDTGGAGHGWFIDVTPGVNEEFLPTSNPDVWVARPGSAAEGKMDILSVLMHEYGHVLGLEHSTDANDVMAALLQPGVRKLWSESDLAKLNEAIVSNSPEQDRAPVDHNNDRIPARDQTRITVQADRSRVRRGSGPGGDGNASDQEVANAQALRVVNGTLQNGDFETSQTWDTHGAISLDNGEAVLTEADNTMSGLTQAFVMQEGVKGIRFTIKGIEFGNNGDAPSDAFEVAVLDALTGLPVAGVTSQSRTDALFNLQANGVLAQSSSVTSKGIPRTINGMLATNQPITVTIDLSSAQAGKAIQLYFDLLGFGPKNSRVVIDDVKLLTTLVDNVAPVAEADTLTVAEDSSVVIDVLANDRGCRW